jgi:isochorismate synthase
VRSAAFSAAMPDLTEVTRAAISDIAKIEAGRIFSLTMTLPAAALPQDWSPGGECRWLAGEQDLQLFGSGEAAVWANFTDEWRDCLRLGDETVSPIAFFTLPPATENPTPRLWVPRVMVRRHAGRTTLTLTARQGTMPVAQVWAAEIRAMLSAPPRRLAPGAAPFPGQVVSETPDAEGWAARVRAATEAIAAGTLQKVVLARRVEVDLSQTIDPSALADRLAREHPESCVFAMPHGAGTVVAASPERLAVVRDGTILSHALAGTVRRDGDDGAAAGRLLASAKERREHGLVVDTIAARLTEICDGIDYAPEPAVMWLRSMLHLWTIVRGRLRPGMTLLDAVTCLHPTPAVLGLPRQAAADWLAHSGERRDGLYTGIAGWVDTQGNGDAAVVLRSAHVEGRKAVLWAGAGIMAESDPHAEFAETELKMATMLDALAGR